MLLVEGLNSFYGRARILRDISFGIDRGQVLVLLGRNGAGKSTTLKTIVGLVRPSAGVVRFDGLDIAGTETFRIARAGIGYVPEDRRIFADLTVMENLTVGRQPPRIGLTPWTPRRLFELFPNLGPLHDRAGGGMSGGEQQMLAIARTLMGNPRLILLDEPSEGLAPLMAGQVVAAIQAMTREGVIVLLAEQNLGFALRVADRAVVIDQGAVAWSGTLDALRADADARTRYLAV